MKNVLYVLLGLGILLLLVAVVGRFVGNPGLVKGFKVVNVILVANTMFLLAILAKLFEKK